MSRQHGLSVTLGGALLVAGLAACTSEPAVPETTELRVTLLRDSTYALPTPYAYLLRVKNVSTRALALVGCGLIPTYTIQEQTGPAWSSGDQLYCDLTGFRDFGLGTPFKLLPNDSVTAQVFFSRAGTFRVTLPVRVSLDSRAAATVASPAIVLR